jgi:YVTN family beta-propeller protein
MKTSILAIVVAFGAAAATPSAAAPPAYRVTATIAGPDGGWDYAKLDPVTHRLYVARSTSVTVIDIKSAKTLRSIGSFSHGHAVLPISGGRLLVTSGDDATVRFLSAGDGHELGKLAVGSKPDAAILSRDGRQAFVMNADSGTVSLIDVGAMRITGTITVKPALEYAAQTPDGMVFVNNEDAGEIDVIDVANRTPLASIPMPGCAAPSGLAYDQPSGRLIAACANGKAAIVDAKRRALVGLVDIGLGPDAVLLDAKRRLAFVPCGKDGVLDILSLAGPTVTRVGRVVTEKGARTGAIDSASGAIYLPTASFAARPGVNGRPVPTPGSFHVLVVRPVAG